MRFIHVNHRYAPFVGGSERYIQEVSEALARASHDVRLITSNAFDLEYFWDKRAREIEAPQQERINSVHVQRVPVQHIPMNSVIFQGSRRLMGEFSRVGMLPASVFEVVSRAMPRLPDLEAAVSSSLPADLVHVTNLGLEGPGLVASRVARKYDTPLVLTPFIHIGRENDPVARRYVSMPHQKSLLKRSTIIVAMTQIERSFLISLGIDPERIVVSGVGIYPEQVSGGCPDRFREKYGVRGPLVGVASAVAFDKGSREMVLAVRDLRRRGHDVTLVLAGPRLGHFDEWFASLPERDRSGVILPGFISEAEKRDMLAALDILAMPSRTESFGIAYLEGWANSKPIIAARAGAVPELVRHGETGILVEFGDVTAIAEAILRLLGSPEQTSRLAEAGREMTLEQFTWPKVVRRVMRAYELALGHPVIDLEEDASGPA